MKKVLILKVVDEDHSQMMNTVFPISHAFFMTLLGIKRNTKAPNLKRIKKLSLKVVVKVFSYNLYYKISPLFIIVIAYQIIYEIKVIGKMYGLVYIYL